MLLHKDILTISYKHRFEILPVFKNILGLNGIEHFSLDLVSPDAEMLFLSGTPSHGYEICKRGYGPYDGIISPINYENFEFYWWKNATHRAYAKPINDIRENILGLKYGAMLVRKWNDFYLIYSFATKKSDPHFQSEVINKINEFLKMGDFAYNELREVYSEYCGHYEPPKIEKFYQFEGGIPPARYTNDFSRKFQEPLKQHNVIQVDFVNHKKTNI